jgi:lipoprotein-releasing system permease protein
MVLYRLSEAPLRFRSEQEQRGYELRLPDSATAENVAGELRQLLKAADAGEVNVATWGDRNRALFFALKLEKGAMMTFLGLSVLITSFSLVTVLVMLLSQKRKEIGLLMALGLSQRATRSLFLSLGLVLSGVGLFFGLFSGVAVSLFLAKYPLEILPDVYYDSSLPSEVNFTFVIGVGIACLLLAFASAFWPVRHYLRRSPAENLRVFVAE